MLLYIIHNVGVKCVLFNVSPQSSITNTIVRPVDPIEIVRPIVIVRPVRPIVIVRPISPMAIVDL